MVSFPIETVHALQCTGALLHLTFTLTHIEICYRGIGMAVSLLERDVSKKKKKLKKARKTSSPTFGLCQGEIRVRYIAGRSGLRPYLQHAMN